jgi:excisionase family DNA binding protein
MDKALLRVAEAADILSVSRWTIYRWVEEGRLEGTKIGRGSLRVFYYSIEKLVEQNRTENVSNARISGPKIKPIMGVAGREATTHQLWGCTRRDFQSV